MRKKISDEEADKLLEEQYIREAKEMEAGLLRSAGIDPEQESEPEAEEKIKAGYDHLMASLKRKGQYRERYSEDAIINFEDWNRKMEALRLEAEKRKRTHLLVKRGGVLAAGFMMAFLTGMTLLANIKNFFTIV